VTAPRARARLIRWIAAAPVVFLVHDGEELLTIVPWLRAHGASLPAAVQPLTDVTAPQLALAMLALFAGLVIAAVHGVHRARQGARSTLFLVLAGALAANGLTHLGQALVFRGYTPGLITALLVVLPYGYGLGRQLRSHGMLSMRAWMTVVAVGVLLQVPIIVVTLLLARV
jgi:hypothetical protein